MSSDNQFTALGPTEIGFQTDGSNIRMGASIAGREAGVVGHGDTGFGVEGTGGMGGVHGIGTSKPVPEGFPGGTAVGVLGESQTDNGVRGQSLANDGVVGIAAEFGKSGVFGFNSKKDASPTSGGEFPKPKDRAFGVFGACDSPDGVGVSGRAEGGVGVLGTSQTNDGVVGSSSGETKSGVFGFNTKTTAAAFGVFGSSSSPGGAGVSGRAEGGVGVLGTSQTNDGVVGSSNGETKSGVFGFNTKTTGAAFGVSGASGSPTGAGVNGFSDKGYGGNFRGGRAPLRLEPTNTPGRPTSGDHQRGELLVDTNGDLFFCKDSGTPGNWFRVQLTPT
jgi:hypothetical protein